MSANRTAPRANESPLGAPFDAVAQVPPLEDVQEHVPAVVQSMFRMAVVSDVLIL